ncbi:hypothetical protein LP419_31105 [Massilia sp. H-1]|nr:hypothetical protein LP419_31105 [Massilia sp. H-1]
MVGALSGCGLLYSGVSLPSTLKLEAVRAFVLQAGGAHLRQRVGLQAPGEHADLRDVVASLRARGVDAPDVDAVRLFVERPVDQVERAPLAQVDSAAAPRPQMVQVLGPAEQPVEFNGPRRPA